MDLKEIPAGAREDKGTVWTLESSEDQPPRLNPNLTSRSVKYPGASGEFAQTKAMIEAQIKAIPPALSLRTNCSNELSRRLIVLRGI